MHARDVKLTLHCLSHRHVLAAWVLRSHLSDDLLCVVVERPLGIVAGEPPHVADPPNVVPATRLPFVGPAHGPSHNPLAAGDRLQHRAAGCATAPDVVYLAGSRGLEEGPEGARQVARMEVVANLLAPVADHPVRPVFDRAAHQIGEEAVKHRGGMPRTRDAAAAEARRVHAKVASVFLYQDPPPPWRRRTRCAGWRRWSSSRQCHGPRMRRIDLPARFLLDQR